ncbi:uncharacterized protein LOC119325687 [Triticum dicoccoides]|uniref:uncharacterized protein LOC119325687 n=1 Tax=Triticum dicoccoides TaxID=85692 RepID=UPI0018911D79|nr:uncharacterized protein LOC119325687 [Triticum dicoccoides]XP_044414398.1 uncharacterized protein LOC123138485 [Triticum aestivum]
MASLLFRSAAGSALRRSIPQGSFPVLRPSIPQGSFSRSPGRSLCDGAGRIEPNAHSSAKPNMGHSNRFEDETEFCTHGQTEFKELASNIRAMRDKVRLLEKTYEESERSDKRRKVLVLCSTTALLVTFFVFG